MSRPRSMTALPDPSLFKEPNSTLARLARSLQRYVDNAFLSRTASDVRQGDPSPGASDISSRYAGLVPFETRGSNLMESSTKVPARAWVVTFAGMAVNLCLCILYAWSVWKARLIGASEHPAGTPMDGVDAGWTYLTDA